MALIWRATVLNPQPPVLAYARLLIQMHQLIAAGRGDSPEAEELADRMDAPRYAMTGASRYECAVWQPTCTRFREGGPKRMSMSPEQVAEWQGGLKKAYAGEVGNVDAVLTFLRQPVPAGLPAQVIRFLQAESWHNLGDLETALAFMKEADRLDPSLAISVLALLKDLGQVNGQPEYARSLQAAG